MARGPPAAKRAQTGYGCGATMSMLPSRSTRVRASLLAAALLSSFTAGCVFYVEDTFCGKYAYSDRGLCVCESGYTSENPEQGCSPAPTFLITDGCNDGFDVEWKLYSEDRDWSWPSGSSVYVTPGLDFDQYQTIECDEGELICFGGQTAGGLVYGVGIDNSATCEDCCYVCDVGTFDLGYLTCN